MPYRTDLAEEAHAARGAGLPGVRCRTRRLWGAKLTRVCIESEAAARALQKPRGHYVTLTLPTGWQREERTPSRAARTLALELRAMLPAQGAALVAGLGNRAITADAVGVLTVERVLVTRHLVRSMPESFGAMRPVCALAPGVLGVTGVETAEIVRGVCAHVSPSAVVAVDALAAGEAERLCCSFQLSDSGIAPGSGAGGGRTELSRRTLGVPVLALGVPTVITAQTLARREEEALRDLVVTPKDIDELATAAAGVIAMALNLALQPTLHEDEILRLLT